MDTMKRTYTRPESLSLEEREALLGLLARVLLSSFSHSVKRVARSLLLLLTDKRSYTEE